MHLETDPKTHFSRTAKGVVPILRLTKSEFTGKSSVLSPQQRKLASNQGFNANQGQYCLLQDTDGKVEKVLFGLGGADEESNPLACGKLARSLPEGTYKLENNENTSNDMLSALAWAMGGYSFEKYKKRSSPNPKLVISANKDLVRQAEAVFLARDLINTPANDMGPDALEKAFRKLGSTHKAKVSVVKGDNLLKKNFPMVHAVGRASEQAPRVLDMTWGNAKHRKVTLVGKGVTFDTGGLNIKPGSSMSLMKKDMGGAANVMGLAHMIMDAKLPVRLRLIVGAVENSISGNAFRPGDVLSSRKGISVEIGNTDAEGRLVLGDCLALGDEEKPDLMIDMATLTGAARVALGPDLPPFYTADQEFADALSQSAGAVHDPLWQMPLWQPYQSMLSSKIADVNHITAGGFAGSVTAALFLSRFVEKTNTWAHFDIFGWVPSEKPWATVGGEAQGIRAIYDLLKKQTSKP